MRAGFSLLLLFLAGAGAAAAQEGGHLFVSPMGEPYRGATAEADPVALWFTAADTSGDGQMSREEFLSNATTFFARLDANSDASATSVKSTALWRIEAPEVLRVRMVRASESTAPRRAGGMSGAAIDLRAMRPPPAPLVARTGVLDYGLLGDAEPVMSCDADFSRRVTAVEFTACAGRRFTELDANQDGQFTYEEARAARERLRGD